MVKGSGFSKTFFPVVSSTFKKLQKKSLPLCGDQFTFLKLKQFAFQVLVGSIIVLVGSKGSTWYKFASFASDGGSSFASTINGP